MKIKKNLFGFLLCMIAPCQICLAERFGIDLHDSQEDVVAKHSEINQPGKGVNTQEDIARKHKEPKQYSKESLKIDPTFVTNSQGVDLLGPQDSLDPNLLSTFDKNPVKEQRNREQVVKDYLEKLPEKNQPADMAQALQMVKDGAIVSDLIEQGRVYDAVAHNFSIDKTVVVSDQEKILWQKAFNSSDSVFWDLIKDDKVMAKKISHHNIPFSLESVKSVEHGMYFRATYARMYSKDGLVEFVRAYQQSVIQLQWHLFARSVMQEGQAFSSGMISVQDPSFVLFKFFDGYAELVSPKYKLHSSISVHSLVTTKAYTRKSSHYSQAKRFDFDCGIDIQDSKNQPLAILPGNKSHILFGLRSNDMFFVKWENYGVTMNPLENDMSLVPHIKGYFDKKDKQDDPVLERREKVLQDVSEEFKKLYGNKKITGKDKKSIEAFGISYMIKMLDPELQEKFKTYLVTVKKYDLHSLNNRKGNEIILSDLQG